MTIWVDADACPVPIREILYRAVKRTGMRLVLVANQPIPAPSLPSIEHMQVRSGYDEADNEIVRLIESGDLLITADIPLAAEAMEKGATALNPRGELYTRDSIRSRLNMRDFMDTMRASGIQSGGPPPLGQREKQAFGNQLDRWLQQQKT
ncbi:YaiI/YqxD family protein [Halospina sp. K52047b]|uniref:YaiI/YqxD family protein n=1 Tax=Halospina sp. K52047b TaxID=2614160 RepID=UPI00124AD954|nr:YaiI/YqxD family protein [Halospina sp. K52047b]KAA8978518.1 YaiI/YqxD family protein [Halospina sp. K52047b]